MSSRATVMTRATTSLSRPRPPGKLTWLPAEILRNIFRSLFDEAVIELKKPHDLNQEKLMEIFPILAVDMRLLSEGIHVLLHYGKLEIENIYHFPQQGPALKMLQAIRHLALDEYQIVTFALSRQFPSNAMRSSRNSFEKLRKVDINICRSISDRSMNLIPDHAQVPWLIQLVWVPPKKTFDFEFCYFYEREELVEFIKEFQNKYTIVLMMDFWVGGRLVSYSLLLK